MKHFIQILVKIFFLIIYYWGFVSLEQQIEQVVALKYIIWPLSIFYIATALLIAGYLKSCSSKSFQDALAISIYVNSKHEYFICIGNFILAILVLTFIFLSHMNFLPTPSLLLTNTFYIIGFYNVFESFKIKKGKVL